MMKLRIYKEVEIRLPRTKLQQLFDAIYSKEISKKSKGFVNLIFTTDTQLKQMNAQFRNKDRTTDVLSFNLDEPNSVDVVFGEIYISVAQAKRQAADYNATISEELLRLSCHGFLHLLGFDHMLNADEKIMKQKEDKYLNKI